MTNILTIARKELRDALRNKWLLLYTLIFGGLALLISSLSQSEIELAKLASYDRTIASLVNLVLLFVPLIGLTFGATSLAGEHEIGTLRYLLTQPVSRVEVLFGKYLGVGGALLSSITLGFGAAGVVIALQGGGDESSYLLTIVLAGLLSLAMLSLGFLLSALTRKTATALGGALLVWLLLVFIGDLGLIGASIVTEMPLQTTLLIALANPLQSFKIASIFSTSASLDALGPAGVYAADTFDAALLPLLLAILLLWVIVPLGAAQVIFNKQMEV